MNCFVLVQTQAGSVLLSNGVINFFYCLPEDKLFLFSHKSVNWERRTSICLSRFTTGYQLSVFFSTRWLGVIDTVWKPSQAPGRRSVERALCSNQMKQKTLTTKPLRRARAWCGEVGGRPIDFLKAYLGRQRRRRNSYRKKDHNAHSGSRPPATIHARESNNKYSARSYFCK